MDTKKLRQKILDLAIHGKLVPQDPNDEPASVLLERIKAEKERLIKEGKIKRTKKSAKASDMPHYQHDVPFEVPSNWVWTTFGSICKKLTDGSHTPPPKRQEGYTVISAQNIRDGRIVFTNKDRYTDEAGFQKENPRTLIKKGDIILGIIGGSIGNVGIYEYNEPVIAQRSISIIDTFVSNLFCFYLLQTQFFQSFFLEKGNGNAQAGIYLGELDKMLIPLPPFAEQQRIVTEIEHWFAWIDKIEQGKADLQSIIKRTKNKILDLAIHGKLVPQDPNDEPASELLKRINPKAEITTDNGHSVKLPPGWCACKYTDIYTDISSKPYQIFQSQIQESGKYPVVSQSVKHIEGFTDSCNVFSHSLPCIIFGDHTRVVKYIDFDFVVGADGVKIQCPKVNVKWAYYVMEYVSSKIVNKGYSRHFGQVVKFTYALPPLAEQQRIVAKIEELFSTIDSIQKALEA